MPIGQSRKQNLSFQGALIIALTSLINVCACASDSAKKETNSSGAVGGRALDADTGEPIPNAWIFEAIPRETRGADVRRVSSARWTQTDNEGRYTFEKAKTSALGALIKAPAPRYHFYHPSYGLVRGREANETATIIRASLRDSHLRLADLLATTNCTSAQQDSRDPMALQLAKLVCPPGITDRYPNGNERARGPLDDQERRHGDWEFFREDGSLQARGSYAAGAAIEPWVFLP